MINILCYGDSNTWGNIPGSMNKELLLARRYDRETRWTGILQNLLGNQFQVIEAGLNGRNTSFDESLVKRPSRNGLAVLPLILEMHYPIHWVIFMLGTNDVRKEFNASLDNISIGMRKLIHTVKSSHFSSDFQAPQVLFICPPPIVQVDQEPFGQFFNEDSILKSQHLFKHYAQLADEENCLYLNAAEFIKVSAIDGVHFEPYDHKKLAHVILEKLKLGAHNAVTKK